MPPLSPTPQGWRVMQPSPVPPLPTKKLRSEVNSQRSTHRSQTDQTLLMDWSFVMESRGSGFPTTTLWELHQGCALGCSNQAESILWGVASSWRINRPPVMLHICVSHFWGATWGVKVRGFLEAVRECLQFHVSILPPALLLCSSEACQLQDWLWFH